MGLAVLDIVDSEYSKYLLFKYVAGADRRFADVLMDLFVRDAIPVSIGAVLPAHLPHGYHLA
ncbi:hypothetical protein IWQ57_000626 [Coemansia nantahalensis]|uniref:Uncharacterized protein n=1 Tax=Coemansia nantahalensis TaxID=2789366 RepID=A0ACC1K7I7_9FUNG|nr:hypothetical protein IWQ57_000626 [Coemansia nantahalensis]